MTTQTYLRRQYTFTREGSIFKRQSQFADLSLGDERIPNEDNEDIQSPNIQEANLSEQETTTDQDLSVGSFDK